MKPKISFLTKKKIEKRASVKTSKIQGELTRDPNDEHPFRKKQQRAITSGVEDKTLRAVIPDGIVAFMRLHAGNKILWELDMMKGERVAKIRKG